MTIAELLAHPPMSAVAAIAGARRVPVMLVGGAVRDALMGRPSHDLDFSVQGDAIGLARACADALGGAIYVMDAERGVARVLLGDERQRLVLDFVTCRGDSWRADLLDRDFTLNAIACELASGELLDPLGGSADIAAKRIRAVGPDSVASDPVRAIRGVRLARQFGFEIDAGTREQMRQAAPHLSRPSAERVRDALADLLKLPNAGAALADLDALGLLAAVLPETVAMRAERLPGAAGDVLAHVAQVCAALDAILADAVSQPALREHLAVSSADGRTRLVALRLAAVLHDCGKPRTRSLSPEGALTFTGHETAGAALAAKRAAALRFSAAECERVRTIVALHSGPNQLSRLDSAAFGRAAHRFLRQAGDCAPEIVLLSMADRAGKAAGAVPQTAGWLLARYFDRYAPAVSPPPLITGNDILSLGLKPGPRVGTIMEHIREAQMLGEIGSSQEALNLARSLIVATE